VAEETRGGRTKLPRLSHTEDLWNTNHAANAFGHAGVQLLSTSRSASNFRSYRYIGQTSCEYVHGALVRNQVPESRSIPLPIQLDTTSSEIVSHGRTCPCLMD
jgi:hypothetical protein